MIIIGTCAHNANDAFGTNKHKQKRKIQVIGEAKSVYMISHLILISFIVFSSY